MPWLGFVLLGVMALAVVGLALIEAWRRAGAHVPVNRQEPVIALILWLRATGQYGGYRYTQARDPKRNPEAIKRDLATAYVTHRRMDWKDTSRVESFRRGNLIELRRRA